MATKVPTKATKNVSHLVVGAAVTMIGGGVVGFIIGAAAHKLLDAPLAKAMVRLGIQF